MNKVVISAAFGTAVGGGAMAAPYFGVHIPLPTMMAAAAALSMGAAMAVLTRSVLDKPAHHTLHANLNAVRLKKLHGLIEKFPEGGKVLALSIRPETKAETLDVVKRPAQYAKQDIVVTLRASGSTSFNPFELKKLFLALRDQMGFVHLILRDKHDEFVGYIPGFSAKREFTGSGAEGAIARYIVEVFAEPSLSANLRLIGGASKTDIISDEAKVAEAIELMTGGFLTLVVLDGGNHRLPIGLLNFSSLMGHTAGAQIIHHGDGHAGAHAAGHSLGAFRPTK